MQGFGLNLSLKVLGSGFSEGMRGCLREKAAEWRIKDALLLQCLVPC